MTFWGGSGSGSADPCLWQMNPDDRILLFSSLTFKMPAKNKFFNTIFSACYFLNLHLHRFSKIKSQKESQNSRNQGFSYYFCMVIEGSGSGRPKDMWIRWIRIRIRIRNTGFGKISILCQMSSHSRGFLAYQMKRWWNRYKTNQNPWQPLDIKNLKNKIRERKVSRLLPNICDFQ